ncbi:MAG TPA: hypothetical protein VN281_17820 [Verrucomicrobiae bacterium]|nr:hypothetical protein [Verrucomicrobiae bacterium]
MGEKVAQVLKKIRNVRGLSEDEKYLFARSLAATPDERWKMHENFLRSHDLCTRSARKKYGFKWVRRVFASKEWVRWPKDIAYLRLAAQTMKL